MRARNPSGPGASIRSAAASSPAAGVANNRRSVVAGIARPARRRRGPVPGSTGCRRIVRRRSGGTPASSAPAGGAPGAGSGLRPPRTDRGAAAARSTRPRRRSHGRPTPPARRRRRRAARRRPRRVRRRCRRRPPWFVGAAVAALIGGQHVIARIGQVRRSGGARKTPSSGKPWQSTTTGAPGSPASVTRSHHPVRLATAPSTASRRHSQAQPSPGSAAIPGRELPTRWSSGSLDYSSCAYWKDLAGGPHRRPRYQ